MSHFPTRRNQALLVVDVQTDVMAHLWRRDEVIRVIADLVSRARLAGAPVIWVRHQDGELEPGSAGWQIVAELAPEPGEQVVEKRFGDSFAETALDDVLGSLDVDRVVLVGAQSDFCIRSTFFGGLYRGYDMTLVEDAHTTEDAAEGDLDLAAEVLVAVVNKLAWTTRLPGVTAGLASSAELAFGAADALDDEELIEALEAEEQAQEDADDVELGLADDPELGLADDPELGLADDPELGLADGATRPAS